MTEFHDLAPVGLHCEQELNGESQHRLRRTLAVLPEHQDENTGESEFTVKTGWRSKFGAPKLWIGVLSAAWWVTTRRCLYYTQLVGGLCSNKEPWIWRKFPEHVHRWTECAPGQFGGGFIVRGRAEVVGAVLC